MPSSPTPLRDIRRALRLVDAVVRQALRDEAQATTAGPAAGPLSLLTLTEAAAVLGVSKRTVERIVRRGDLGTVLAEGSRRIHPATLDAYVRSRAR